ncbi:hypothetical protein ACA910_021742 [Epithemia clementina (nom. ined.)]
MLVSSLNHSAVSLVYLEAKPIITENLAIAPSPSLSSAAVKVFLLNWSCDISLSPSPLGSSLKIQIDRDYSLTTQTSIRRGRIYIEKRVVENTVGNSAVQPSTKNTNDDRLVLWLPQLDPNLAERWPCECHGYVKTSEEMTTVVSNFHVIITEETMVRILPASTNVSDHLTGEMPKPVSGPFPIVDYSNHNPETIRELTIRLRRLMSEPVMIGTGPDLANGSHSSNLGVVRDSTRPWNPPKYMEFQRDGALIVRSAHHGDGKTLLVEQLARHIGCSLVHILSIGPILSKHGVHADMALETILHQSALAAALQNKPICIILDHLSSMLPPVKSTASDAGDAANQVLSAIAAYLRMLTHSLYHDKVFPFPVKNNLYNIHATKCHYLPLRLCLVAVDTSPDPVRASQSQVHNHLLASHYRLSPLTAQTRLTAFQHAMDKEGVVASPSLREKMPYLAASAVWARGKHFEQVARYLRYQQQQQAGLQHPPADAATFSAALKYVRSTNAISSADVEFLAPNDTQTESFDSIGGQTEAKAALEEALALDESKRRIMSCFGMAPPTGLLLFGPPGCGKTLMAKAVAKMLKGSSLNGGAFVSINTTDVARAHVGSGEKMLVTAFETARLNAPSVIFIDEFQALFTERTSGGSSRLTSTLLSAMDDCKAWAELEKGNNRRETSKNDKRVVILAATNTPWMVDRAFLRAGRFDRIVHVGLPSEEERFSIMKLLVRNMKISFDSKSPEFDRLCRHLAQSTQGYSGADLAALCRSATVFCILENGTSLQQSHFMKALDDSQPSSSSKLVERIAKWNLRNQE